MNTIPERVAAGAATLDTHKPGWRSLVDVDDLDVVSCFDCVLGQVYGNYTFGIRRLAGAPASRHFQWALDHGFAAHEWVVDGPLADADALNAEWRRVLEAGEA